MSLDLKSIHVRLSHEAYAALRLVADVSGQDLGQAARLILTESILGKVHTINKALGKVKQ